MIGFTWRGAAFFYLRNLQGDIVGIYNEAGTVIVKYSYDAWGKLLTCEDDSGYNLGEINPIRYRGYYYDTETGYYYCQSRYYNPQWCRWISADVYADTGDGILSTNTYAYCQGDPINCSDSTGMWKRNIHKGSDTEGTLYWAQLAGLSEKHAKTVANACAGVDTGIDNPVSNYSAHFLAHGAKAFSDEHFNNAVNLWKEGKETASLKELGVSLHALQDQYAHLDWNVPIDSARTKEYAKENKIDIRYHLIAKESHVSWSPDMSEWSASYFDDPDYFVWRGSDGFFYHTELNRWLNPRYLMTFIQTQIRIGDFIRATGYPN